MAQTYEIVFFSVQPGCSLQAIEDVLCRLLEKKPDDLWRALRSSGSVLIGGLSEAEAKSLQIRLVASGLLCNYRPASPPCELSLKPKSFTMPCPHCGQPNQIIENERRRRCRHCRRFWSLWAMRQDPPEIALPPEPSAVPAPRSWGRSWAAGAALLLLMAYLVADGLPLMRSWARDIQNYAPPPTAKAKLDDRTTEFALDPFELAWMLDSAPRSANQSFLSPPALLDKATGASVCGELARLCQSLKPLRVSCLKEATEDAIRR
ncbi:hypothetical protein [Methylothermus subterraneus]